MSKQVKQLRAVFRVTPEELRELTTYGKVLAEEKNPCLMGACNILGTRRIIVGAGYIENAGAERMAKGLIPIRDSNTLWVTVNLDGYSKYCIAPSRILRDQPRLESLVVISGAENDYFPDAPDTAVIIGTIAPEQIIKVETYSISSIKNLLELRGDQRKPTILERFKDYIWSEK